MKQRYFVQRTDDDRYFCHPSKVGKFTQWTKDISEAHWWADLDICLMAINTCNNVWCIPAKVHTLAL